MKRSESGIGDFLRRQPQVIILVLLVATLSLVNPHFRSVGNFINLLRQVTAIGIISAGMTLVMITGCLDLSVGSAFSLLNLVTISFQQHNNILAVLMPLLIAVAIGLFNGLIVTSFNVNSIIVTLGSLSLLSGLAYLYSNGAIISGPSGTWYSYVGTSTFFGIPISVMIFVVIVAIYQFLLAKTRFGRKIVYVGTNVEAAEIASIRTKRIRTTAFVISSLSVALAALLYSSRMGTGSPVTGVGFEFSGLTAMVIGGTSLLGGKGSVIGTVVGVLILAVVVNALILYNAPYAFQDIAEGILIIVALIADVVARNRVVRTSRNLVAQSVDADSAEASR